MCLKKVTKGFLGKVVPEQFCNNNSLVGGGRTKDRESRVSHDSELEMPRVPADSVCWNTVAKKVGKQN